MKTYDIAVIGAGVFGAWIAYTLREAGCGVLLVDQYGAANERASSGGETRIIRMGYGPEEIYTRWAVNALEQWKMVFTEMGEEIFYRTGVLLFAEKNVDQLTQTVATLTRVGVPFQQLSRAELEKNYPQFDFGSVETAVLEPNSGAIGARRAVQSLVRHGVTKGIEYRIEPVALPAAKKRLDHVTTARGERIHAGTFIFACGPWLPKMFPALLARYLFITRQEEFYFRAPDTETSFQPPAFPVWIEIGAFYGFPDLEHGGVKIASDEHGPLFDPDIGDRATTPEGLRVTREFMARRFPRLSGASLVNSRVCQFENTSNGDFLIDRHPDIENAWIVGGGSGHGFKHGPSIGRYVCDLVLTEGGTEERFAFGSKRTVKNRMVY
jgi:monomeric sarcosine oxidase